MKSFFNPAAKPSIGWPRNLSRSAALLLLLMLVAAPWHSTVAAADNPNDGSMYCGTPSTCATPDGVTFSVEQSKGREGTDATVDFTVTVDNPRSESMTWGWRTRDGSTIPGSPGWAYEGEDFTASSGSLSIAPGRSSHTISIPIIDDSIQERNENFYLELDVGPRGPDVAYDYRYLRYYLFHAYIYSNWNDDVPVDTSRDYLDLCWLHGTCETPDGVTFSVTQPTGREGTNETLDFTVTVDNPHSESMTVGWRTNDSWSGATAGEDYTASSGSLSIAPGRSSHTVSIPIIDDDSTPEVVESVALELDVGPRRPELPRRAYHLRYLMFVGWILPEDDTTAPTVTVTHDSLTTTAGPWATTRWNHVRIDVEFSEPAEGFDKSDLEFENGRVVEITANDGSYRRLWVVHIVPNEGWRGTMSIRVPAGAATDSAGLSNTASNTIELPVLGTSPTDVAEPDRQGRDVVLSCSASSDPAVWDHMSGGILNRHGVHVEVSYSIDTFFEQANGPYGWNNGPDGRPYFDMTGAMSLTNEFGVQASEGIDTAIGSGSSRGWNARIAQGMTGQLTLQVLPGSIFLWNGSAPMAVAGRGWSVAAADASATEGTDGTVDFEVRLNARDDCKAVKVDYATADGTATAGEDYSAASGTLTFQPGESVKTIRIPVLADAGSERGETFALRLSNALGVAIADTEAIGTIRDDDVPTLSRASVDDAVLTLSFSEALDGDSVPPASAFAVTVAGSARTVDAVAIAGSAVTLTLSSAVSSGESVTVGYTVPTGAGARPVTDTTGNAAVAFSNTSVTNETAVLPVVSIAASATPVTEGTAAAFSLSRTGATDAALTVEVSVSETGATEAGGGGTVPVPVTFEAGSASVTLSMATEDDGAVEDASTVTATVSPGTGYIVDSGSASADVIVEDNDAAPVVTTASPILVPENSAAVATLAATDEDTAAENLSWSIPEGADGGADAAKFALTAAGVLTFKAAKDYESPDDANTDGDYEVTVRVTDGANPVDAALVVRLTDVDEVAPTLSSASVDGAGVVLIFDEALDEGSAPSAASFAVTVAGSSRGVASVWVYGRTVLLELSSAVVSGEAVAVGYTVPTGERAMPVKDVAGNVAAAFSNTEVTNETAALPVVSTASPIVVAENATAVATLTATDADTAAEDLTWSIPEGEAGGDDAAKFALTSAGVLTFKTAKDFEAPDDADNDGDYEVTVRVTDGANPVDAALVVRLSDVAETEPLTASLAKMPETHDGSSTFQFEVHFSEEPRGLSYRTVRDGLFDVTNGRVIKAKRLTRGSNLAFVVTVEPTAQADIDVAVLGTASCGAAHAVCADGKTLAAGPSVTVLDARTITLTVADAAVDEGPGATLDFVASLSRAASGDITVSYNTTNEGTATAGVDYEAVDSSFVFSAGQTEKTISVAVLDDALDEVSETVNLAITATVVNGVAVSVADNIAIGTIRDVEDVTPTMSRASVDGADLTLTFSEALDGDSVPPGSAFAVTVADAARSVDAVAISESALTLTLSSAVSSGETVAVRYTVPTGAGAKPLKDAAGNMVTGFSKTSVRNETAVLPVVSIAASATPVTEGTAAAFTLSRTGATTAALEVTVSVAESEAAVSGTPPTQVTFEAGSASATLSVATEDDEAVEGASTVTATVSSGTDYTVDAESGSAEVVVNDDDAAPVVTTATPIEVPENATAVATLAATDADTAAEDLTWSIPEGADGGADAAKFALTEGGELTFRTAKDFEAPDDANADGNYEVTVRVTDGANPVDAALVVRLTDVDEIELSVADAEVEEGPGATLDFVVSLSHAADDDITVYYRVHDADGTATAGADYEPVRSSFVFSPGETQRTVSVVVLDDTLNEGAETVNFWISGVRGLTIQQVVDPYATGTILESDQDSEPVTLSVADAEVDEGPGATLDFVVNLSRAADDDITVYYRVHDGTATAGTDYEAVRSSFVLSPGQTEKTVSVVVLDDALDEGAETVNFSITGVRGLTAQQVVDPYATGTIRNTDKMPTAWIARFGRTVAEHVLDAVEARREAAPTPGMEASLAGQRIGGGGLPEDNVGRQGMGRSSLSDWLTGQTDPQRQNLGSRTITERDLLTGSSFALTAQTKGSGLISVWGRGAVTRFDGREGDLAIDGEVASGMLGADWTEGAWKTGLLVTHSLGDGGYRGASAGTVTSTLTGIFPWARHALSERISVWGAAGYGEGSLTLEPEEQPKIRTDLDLWMAAAGLRGVLVDGGQDGPTLAAKTDAMIVRTSSDAVSGGSGNLAAAEAEVTRLRLGLEGSQPLTLAKGATLTPSVEIGVRHDGGDAETGFGVDIGGGLAWSDTIRGITAEFRGRGLLTHEADGFRERGLSGSLSWDPTPASDRGPRASLTQTLGGSASGGMDELLSRDTLTGLAANDNGNDLQQRRLEARFGYGFAAFGDRFTSSPEISVGLSNTGRDYSLGWRLVRGGGGFGGGSFELSVEAQRREAANDDIAPEHQVGFRVNARF